jgi:hypothetical protein
MMSLMTLEWTRIETGPNSTWPSARYFHVMATVGMDLWVHGGQTSSGEDEACVRVCLIEHHNMPAPDFAGSWSDCVCCGVFSAPDICVSRAGYSDETWTFSTSTRDWTRIDTGPDGIRPKARGNHAMAALGTDLWLHGGQTDLEYGEATDFARSWSDCVCCCVFSATSLLLHVACRLLRRALLRRALALLNLDPKMGSSRRHRTRVRPLPCPPAAILRRYRP